METEKKQLNDGSRSNSDNGEVRKGGDDMNRPQVKRTKAPKIQKRERKGKFPTHQPPPQKTAQKEPRSKRGESALLGVWEQEVARLV